MRSSRRRVASIVALGAAFATMLVGPASAGPTAETARVRILVTNDDGVAADGIDALVRGLQSLPDVEVVVVAPLEDMSGTGQQVTTGPVTAIPTTTKSGFLAIAVDGFPADAVNYAVKELHVEPDLVMSGINAGANLGAISYGSGTVGAAKQAGRLGFPSLALSQGDEEPPADYPAGVAAALSWLAEHRAALAARRTPGGPAIVESMNIPTCTVGAIRGMVRTRVSRTAKNAHGASSDCTSTLPPTNDDISSFIRGFTTVAWVPNFPK